MIKKSEQSILPNFFVVGAAKAGTTSLYEYLNQHPQVYMSPIKEPNYFSSDIDISAFTRVYRSRLMLDMRGYFLKPKLEKMHLAYIRDWDYYCKLFEAAHGQKARGEASATYLYSETAAKNIKKQIPDAKIIMILRNPIDRAYSHYLMDLRDGRIVMPFLKAIETDRKQKKKGWGISHLYVELGMYYDQVKRYSEIYDRDHLRIYLYEDLRDCMTLVKDIYHFLNIDEDFEPDISKSYNVARVPVSAVVNYIIKNSPMRKINKVFPASFAEKMEQLLYSGKKVVMMAAQDRSYLEALYRDDVNRLSQLIKRDLSSWL